MGPWMTAMHLFRDKCKTKCCHSTTAFPSPLSISITVKISPRKQMNRNTSPNAWAVAQCPVDKVWSKHCTGTGTLAACLWQTEYGTFEISLIRGRTEILVHKPVFEKLWNVKHNFIRWLWQITQTFTSETYLLMLSFVKSCFVCSEHEVVRHETELVIFSPFLPTIIKKKHHGWHVFDTLHLFCLWMVCFKEGQYAAIAKCVTNKWCPS